MNFLSRKYWYQLITPVLQHAGAYSPGYSMDVAKKVTAAAVGTGEPARLASITVTDKAMQNANLSLHFFQQALSPVSVDNTVFDPAVADLAQFIGTVKIDSSNYYTYSTHSAATVIGSGENGLLPFKPIHSRDIYVQVVCDDSPTYASTSDLGINLLFDQDR